MVSCDYNVVVLENIDTKDILRLCVDLKEVKNKPDFIYNNKLLDIFVNDFETLNISYSNSEKCVGDSCKRIVKDFDYVNKKDIFDTIIYDLERLIDTKHIILNN